MTKEEDLRKLYNITEKDDELLSAIENLYSADDVENKNVSLQHIAQTDTLSKDITVREYLSMSSNQRLMDYYATLDINPCITVDCTAGALRSRKISSKALNIQGGFEKIISKTVEFLHTDVNTNLFTNSEVARINEDNSVFTITTKRGSAYTAKRIIYACSGVGLNSIEIQSDTCHRQSVLRELADKVQTLPGFKMFLTYRNAWWERYGFYNGSISTDLHIKNIMVVPQNQVSEECTTLMVAYTGIVESLDHFKMLDDDSNERFENQTTTEVREYMVPSKRLVEDVQKQVQQVLGK